MKVKIIKRYQVRENRFWEVDLIAGVTNEFGKELIDQGFAHEVRIEKRKDSKGNDFEVEVEVIDKQGNTKSKRVKEEIKDKQ
jgi:hypothetical protein